MTKYVCPHCGSEGPFYSVEKVTATCKITFNKEQTGKTPSFEYTGEGSEVIWDTMEPSIPPTFNCRSCGNDLQVPKKKEE